MIAVLLCVYKRHDLEEIVINRLKKQSEKFGFEIVVVGSEGEKSKSLAKNCHYVECENYPVSFKHQKGLDKCKELGVDGVVVIGSDDICCDNYWKWATTIKTDKVIGFKDFYFYQTLTKKLFYFEGYENKDVSLGAFRYYPKSVLDLVKWNLWGSEKRNKGLDSLASLTLFKAKQKEKLISMESIDAFLCDIKHERNITNHAFLDNLKEINVSIMAKRIKSKEIESLEPKAENINTPIKLEIGKMYKFESNGKSKHLPIGLYTLESHEAELFVNRGYGVIAE